jgi:hypothetical protein
VSDDLEREVDALYELPASEFTATRNELAKRAPKERRDEIRALKRPSQSAATVNRLVRGHRGDVERFVEAGRTLRSAQAGGEDVADALRTERDALAALLETARAEGATSDSVVSGVRTTLQAAAADDDAARTVLEARLEKELEPPGFAPLLEAAAAAGPSKRRDAKPAARPRRDLERERREREARRAAEAELRAAERDEREARRAWEQAQKRLEQARRRMGG